MTSVKPDALRLIQGIRDTLQDTSNPSTIDILQCGPAVLPLLVAAFIEPVVASTLLALANEHIQSTPFNLVKRHWLRLYVDASIALATSDPDGIRLLDMSIIVAGALGQGRMDCIQTLIRHLQGPPEAIQNGSIPDPERQPHRIDSIPSIPPPSLQTYRQNCQTPFILRGYLEWPALEKWQSFDYLLQATGPGRVVPVERGRSYDQPDWGQEIIPWSEFLEMMTASTPNKNPPYLAQHSLFNQFPALEADIGMPDYVWSEPELAHTQPPEPIVNVWVGNGIDGVVSPPHTDPYFNCYAQILGQKRVWLAPPDTKMRPYDDSDDLTGYMSNTSPAKVFETVHEGLYATLYPGDLLVFPPKWWHSTKADGPGVVWNISYWY